MNQISNLMQDYSSRIKKCKIFLFAILFLSFAAIFVSLNYDSLENGAKLSITDVKEEISAKTTKPIFKARNKDGNICQVSAEYLLQKSTDLIFLYDVRAIFEDKKKETLAISSREARYIRKDKHLYFDNFPKISYKNCEFLSENIFLDLKKNLLYARKITSFGHNFSLKAANFFLEKDKELIRLEGHVTLNYIPNN